MSATGAAATAAEAGAPDAHARSWAGPSTTANRSSNVPVPKPLAKAAFDFFLALQSRAGIAPKDAIATGVKLVEAGWNPGNAEGLLAPGALETAGVASEEDRIKIAKAVADWKLEQVEKKIGELTVAAGGGPVGESHPTSPTVPTGNAYPVSPTSPVTPTGQLTVIATPTIATSGLAGGAPVPPGGIAFTVHSRVKSGPVPLPNTGPGVASLARKEASLSHGTPHIRTMSKMGSGSWEMPPEPAAAAGLQPASLKQLHHAATHDPAFSTATHPAVRPGLARGNSFQGALPSPTAAAAAIGTLSRQTPPSVPSLARAPNEPTPGTALRKIPSRSPILALCLHPMDPSRLYAATGGPDNMVAEWSVPYGAKDSPTQPVAFFVGQSEPVTAMAISPTMSALYTASEKVIREYSLSGSPQRLPSRTFKASSHLHSIHIAGDKIYAGGTDKTVKEWDLRTGAEIRTLKVAGLFDRTHPVSQLALSSDMRSLFAIFGDGVTRFDLWSDEKVSKIKPAPIGEREPTHPCEVTDFVISPDGRYLVTGGTDGYAREHLVATGVTTKLFNHGSPLHRVRVFEGRLFTISAETTKEWDMQSGECKGIVRQGGLDAVLVVVGSKTQSGVVGEARRVWIGGDGGVAEFAV